MLRRLSHGRAGDTGISPGAGSMNIDMSRTSVPAAEASFPSPFDEGLECSTPARGCWNIMHTGFLIPEAHQIFVCARGCLRGVAMTAAEMDALDRYSAIEIREENVFNAGIEDLMIDGVDNVLNKLSCKPRAVLLYINCQHFFLAYDQEYVFNTIKNKYSDIDFIDCYMIPTLRKSGITPDQKMRIQMYEGLKKLPYDDRQISVIGSDLRIDESSEIYEIVREAGYRLVQIQDCGSYDEYLNMARSPLNLYLEPIALNSAERLEQRLGQKYMYMPYTFNYEKLEENYSRLCEYMNVSLPDFSGKRQTAEEAIEKAGEVVGDMPVAVDYTFTFLVLSFSRWLLEHGFNVKEIFVDNFYPEEKEDFEWMKEQHPDVKITACSRPEMRVLPRERGEEYLAVGQKAAYFTGSDHFVNVVEGGGYMGYGGMVKIAELIREAALQEKDRRALIQKKGYGCVSLI